MKSNLERLSEVENGLNKDLLGEVIDFSKQSNKYQGIPRMLIKSYLCDEKMNDEMAKIILEELFRICKTYDLDTLNNIIFDCLIQKIGSKKYFVGFGLFVSSLKKF